jgi:trigger factor
VGTVDGEPFQGGDARGYLLEIGSGRLIPGFEDQLRGAKGGDEREVKVTFPEDYQAEHLAGREAVFATTVKEVKEKRLPELDDDFAAEAGGFDTLDELRSDVESRLREAHERAIDGEFREAVVDAAVAEAKVDVSKELIHAKAHEMWENTARRLQRQGLDPQQYLQFAGKDEHQLIEDAEPDAEKALKREAVLAAVVDAEGIEVSDEELLDSLRQTAGNASDKEVRKAFDRMKQQGRDDLLREDVAMRKAVDLLVDGAQAISVDQAKARDKLWTPEKEKSEATSEQIWTPGS